MKAFLLLLGAQMVCQLEAAHHSKDSTVHGPKKGGKVCAVAFWDHKKTPAAKDNLDDSVVVISTGVKAELPKGSMVEFGAMVTEPGAWMTISDGAFVTIDEEGLECGLEGCKSPPTSATSGKLGYDRSSDKIVSCSSGKDDIGEELKKFCPKFKGSAIIDKGGEYACFVGGKEKEDYDKKECEEYGYKTKIKTSWDKKPAMSCMDGVKHIATTGGIDKLPKHHRIIFETVCCDKYGAELEKMCPKLEAHTVFDKGGMYYCDKGEKGTGEGKTPDACKKEGGLWKKTELTTCGRMAQHILLSGMDKIDKVTLKFFETRCCGHVDDSIKKTCPHYDGKKIFDKGGSYYCELDGVAVDSFVASAVACKELATKRKAKKHEFKKSEKSTCEEITAYIASKGGLVGPGFKTMYTLNCCSGGPSTTPSGSKGPKDCPKFDGKKMLDKSTSCAVAFAYFTSLGSKPDAKPIGAAIRSGCCGLDDGIREELKKSCPKFKGDALMAPGTTCEDMVKFMAHSGGIEKAHKSSVIVFEGQCCDKYGPEIAKICPKLDAGLVLHKGGDEYCEKKTGSGDEKTLEACKKAGGKWTKSEPSTCGMMAQGLRIGGLDKIPATHVAHFRTNCCSSGGGGSKDGIGEDLKKFCPKFKGDAPIAPGMTCKAGAKFIADGGGIEKAHKSHVIVFEGQCCDKYGPEIAKICPKFDSGALFDKGGHMYCEKETGSGDEKTPEACKKAGGKWSKSEPSTCGMMAQSLRIGGLDKVPATHIAHFKTKCCGHVDDSIKKACPHLDGKKIFDKGDSYYCELDGVPILSFVSSEAACKIMATKRKAKKYALKKSEKTTCEDIVPTIVSLGGLGAVGPGFKTIFNLNCCSGGPKTTPSAPKVCPNFRPEGKAPGFGTSSCGTVAKFFKSLDKLPPALKEGFVKSCCGKKESSCPATCSGKTCDHWLKEASYTCKSLEKNYKCDCGGCECKVDEEQKKCAADLCFKRTCPEWEGKHGVKCEVLTGVFGCSCNGCNCKKTLHKCDVPERKGDSYCDDENNKADCDWDGGDCCQNKESNDKQFFYCKACKCLDPTGTPSKRDCALPVHKGDNHCDDGNNKLSCSWDGGDCCASSSKSVNTKYCEECRCLDPTHKGSRCIDQRLGDGFCDDANNVAACKYDKGDCCAHGHNSQFLYCHECQCLDPNVHKTRKCDGKCGSPTHKGDKYCDDDNNRCGCGWDGGDCCGKTGNSQQYEYCHQCKCLDAKYTKPACGVLKFKGDGICDDDNNNKACGWDAGDCCTKPPPGKTLKKDQFKYCTKCMKKCLDKKY